MIIYRWQWVIRNEAENHKGKYWVTEARYSKEEAEKEFGGRAVQKIDETLGGGRSGNASISTKSLVLKVDSTSPDSEPKRASEEVHT